MELFRVIEDGEGIERAILRALGKRGGTGEVRVSARHPSLLVVSPEAAEKGLPLPERCRTVLLPGERPPRIQAASAVSYGLSPRDSLTVSSREGDTLWAALQREVVTVAGQVVERQEFSLAAPPGAGELSLLAAAGALLLMGVPAPELEGLELRVES